MRLPFYIHWDTDYKYEEIDEEDIPAITSTQVTGINLWFVVWQTKRFEYEHGKNQKKGNVQIITSVEG